MPTAELATDAAAVEFVALPASAALYTFIFAPGGTAIVYGSSDR